MTPPADHQTFFCNLLTGFACVRFNNDPQLAVVNHQRMSATFLIFKAHISITKSSKLMLSCTFVYGSPRQVFG
uniref:Secreted protein n=1 Tax=Heterorhabditis bacteriophora TaxID=37862 RepID=A0A1I7X1U7_HETBA